MSPIAEDPDESYVVDDLEAAASTITRIHILPGDMLILEMGEDATDDDLKRFGEAIADHVPDGASVFVWRRGAVKITWATPIDEAAR